MTKVWVESRHIVCIDFNGVLDTYTGWISPEHTYPPRAGVDKFLKKLVDGGYVVVVLTSADKEKVEKWLKDNNLMQYVTRVTNEKIPALVYVDDRAIKFQGDYDLTLSKIKHFKTFWESPKHHEGGYLGSINRPDNL